MDMCSTPIDHLSPPSTTSRLSDSDTTSECDIDGLAAGRDGASISSVGSSSSPPAEVKTNHTDSINKFYSTKTTLLPNFKTNEQKKHFRIYRTQ